MAVGKAAAPAAAAGLRRALPYLHLPAGLLVLLASGARAHSSSARPHHHPLPVQFDSVWNFRRVRGAHGVYRSAALDGASEQDLQSLTGELALRTVIDLRGDDERRELLLSKTIQQFPQQQLAPSPAAASSDGAAAAAQRCMYHISLLETDRYYRGIYATWPAHKRAYVSAVGLLSSRAESALFVDDINAGGLPAMNRMLLSTAQEDICRVLKIVAHKDNHPVVFHCAKGKDRTGLVAMLVQCVLGDSREQIVCDYAASAALLSRDPEEAEERARRRPGVPQRGRIDWTNFEGSPPELMQGLLEHMDERYGGVEAYLDSIGFDEAWRQRLREACLCEELVANQ